MMSSNDFCNTELELGLGFSSSSDDNHYKPVIKSQSSPQQNREPSLNLTLSNETHDLHHCLFRSDDHISKAHPVNDHKSSDDGYHLHRQDSGGASSFSNNLSVKRERVEYPCNNKVISDEEEDEKYGLSNVRKKLRLTKAQSALLEESFKLHSTLNPRQKQELARELKLRPRQVEVWFQNRRARTKLKQTEVDCELLKKCCENLTQENLRLHKEIQQLKSLTSSAHHHYKQCPSCESKRSLYSRHFTNNHPSAAC